MTTLSTLIKNAGGSIDESVLNPHQLAYYKAKTARDAESFRVLANVAIATLPTGVHPFRGIEKLVRIYFGHGISFISVRTDLRCKDAQVKAYRKAVNEAMVKVRESLKSEIERMNQCG